MKRTILAGTTAGLAVFLLVGCGSGSAPAPALPPVSTTAPAMTTIDPSAANPSASGPAAPSASATASTDAPGVPAVPGGAGPQPGGGAGAPTGNSAPGGVPAPPPAGSNATVAYAARFCTALSPLVALKQEAQAPNMAGVTDGPSAKALAVRLLNDGIAKGQSAVQAVAALGPAPDPQAAAGVNSLLATLRQGITVGQGLLPQVQAVDPNNPLALVALAQQAKGQLGTSEATGLSALRTSTGPALGAALQSAPECKPLGI